MKRLSFLVPLALVLAASACTSPAAPPPAGPNVILITFDGLRQEEVFTGADSLLLFDERHTENPAKVAAEFWKTDPDARRTALLPFFWSTIASQGRLYGNRALGSDGVITNGLNFSYPGYNELLSGRADSAVNSNDKIPNTNVTVLEWVNRQPGFEGKVAAFGSWDVFPYIINEERAGIPVNAGFETGSGESRSERELFLDEMQPQVPSPWETVRLDVFTHHYAFEYLKRARPRLLYVAYGETDDFAHDGEYAAYLRSARTTDSMIRDLWTWVQSTDGYRDNTWLVITTDHGRSTGDRWVGHGTDWEGSGYVWLAVLGPGLSAGGEMRDADFRLEQVAATVAARLGLDFTTSGDVAEPVGLE